MTSTRISKRGAKFDIVGRIDHNTDFSSLIDADERPIQLNVAGITGITSLGAKKLRDLISTLGNHELQLHECPHYLVGMFNIVPEIVRTPGHIVDIKSFMFPFLCPKCALTAEALLRGDEITIKDHYVKIPAKRCHACKAVLQPSVDPQDFFYFIASAN